jgi:hypothetical protein
MRLPVIFVVTSSHKIDLTQSLGFYLKFILPAEFIFSYSVIFSSLYRNIPKAGHNSLDRSLGGWGSSHEEVGSIFED